MQKIQNRVIDYLKTKIYLYDYRMYQAPPGNPYINELGLDQTAYYAHPADKYLPERLSRIIISDEIMDATAEDYDMLYGNVSDGYSVVLVIIIPQVVIGNSKINIQNYR